MIFDAPVRIRWDADPPIDLGGGTLSPEKPYAIYEAIREAAPLSLDATVVSPEILEGLLTRIIEAGDPMAVSLYLSESIVSVQDARLQRAGQCCEIIFHAKNCSDLNAERFWFAPDPEDYGTTFHVLDKFLKSRGKLLIFRNPNFRKNGPAAEILPPDFGGLKEAFDWGGLQGLADRKVIVHDYFLWKFFRDALQGFGDKRAEFDGCQGGNTLAYIDWEGVVYPCETLLIPLGRVPEEDIAGIWMSPARGEIAGEIRKIPPACEPCRELPGCLGGCRGLSHHLKGTVAYPDPQCCGKR